MFDLHKHYSDPVAILFLERIMSVLDDITNELGVLKTKQDALLAKFAEVSANQIDPAKGQAVIDAIKAQEAAIDAVLPPA